MIRGGRLPFYPQFLLTAIIQTGKTVLCSTIIENVESWCCPETRCVYFYFDFSDPAKKNVVNMLYSFLAQLSIQEIHADVRRLYEACGRGNLGATVTQLTNTLITIARERKTTYVLVDALDESSDREALSDIITTIHQSGQFNLLLT